MASRFMTWSRDAKSSSSMNLRGYTIAQIDNRGGEQRNHDLVVADERISAARAARGRTRDDVGLRPVHADEVQIHRCQVRESDPLVAAERDGLEKHFREHDRRS